MNELSLLLYRNLASKQDFCVYRSLAKFDYSLYFYFYERKQNKCLLVLYCDIIAIKEHCCWLIFFKNFST